jgi:hypothetical protein
MSVEPERIRALDKATKQLLWDRMIASKQTVSTYVVVLDGGSLETMELSAAQAEGFECLTCRVQCSRGAGSFVPVGRIPSVGSVFQCVACSVGAR